MLETKNMEFRVLTIDQKDLILQTERAALSSHSEVEKQMLEWKAPWRSESLDHYLNARWCMGIFDASLAHLQGYFLAQPFLFFEGYTQNLWIEHLYYQDKKIGEALVDLAIRYGKDKHLQRVLFKKNPIFETLSVSFPLNIFEDRIEVLTTKLVL